MKLLKILFNDDLYKSLSTGSTENKETSISLVSFRIPKKGSKVLVYRCIHYPDVFKVTLLFYLVTKISFSKSPLFKH